MFVPILDDRLFTKPADTNLFTSTPFHTAEEYEQEYPLLLMRGPELFSINLQDDLIEFITSVPPGFKADIHEVIDFACFYYSDWDTAHMAVLDEFIEANALDEIRRNMMIAHYDFFTAEKELQRQIDMLSDALRKFVNVILGMLARANVPAIMDFGSCYRLFKVDDFGNVFFRLENPTRVYDEVENSCLLTKKVIEPKQPEIRFPTTLVSDLPGNY
jgi:hypothetical protein